MTVCHLLGNGSYHLLTFDDNALTAHLGHGDLYPVPASGCPAEQAAGTAPAGTSPLPGTEGVVNRDSAANATRAALGRPAAVLGVESVRSTSDAALPGTRAVPANRPAAVLGAQAAGGLLPQTGAGGPLGMALLAGLGLLGAGVATLTRKRLGSR